MRHSAVLTGFPPRAKPEDQNKRVKSCDIPQSLLVFLQVRSLRKKQNRKVRLILWVLLITRNVRRIRRIFTLGNLLMSRIGCKTGKSCLSNGRILTKTGNENFLRRGSTCCTLMEVFNRPTETKKNRQKTSTEYRWIALALVFQSKL